MCKNTIKDGGSATLNTVYTVWHCWHGLHRWHGLHCWLDGYPLDCYDQCGAPAVLIIPLKSYALTLQKLKTIFPMRDQPIHNLMKWWWPSSSYSCWLLPMIWLAFIFMTYFFLEPEKVSGGSKIVTSIFCQSSMSPDHSGVGVQFIHISHTSSKSNPNFPKTLPKTPSRQPIHQKIPS